jgi:hypothetical protein
MSASPRKRTFAATVGMSAKCPMNGSRRAQKAASLFAGGPAQSGSQTLRLERDSLPPILAGVRLDDIGRMP